MYIYHLYYHKENQHAKPRSTAIHADCRQGKKIQSTVQMNDDK